MHGVRIHLLEIILAELNGLITLLLHDLVQLLHFLSHTLCLETKQHGDSEADKNYQFILDWCILAADSI